jgi:hypothetical protein
MQQSFASNVKDIDVFICAYCECGGARLSDEYVAMSGVLCSR